MTARHRALLCATSLPIAFCLLAAFSRGAHPAAVGNAPSDPCDVITAADVSGILTAPATRKPGATPGSCMYQTRSRANVTISVARGNDAKGAWMLATTYNATKQPLSSVAEEALYDPDGTTLIARKGDTSCRVDVVGYDNSAAMGDITKDRGEALARKLGALCKKLLASH